MIVRTLLDTDLYKLPHRTLISNYFPMQWGNSASMIEMRMNILKNFWKDLKMKLIS